MEACKQYYTSKYVRLPDLLIDMEVARNEGKCTNPLLLILDEWLLLKPNEHERKDIFELLHNRRKKTSTIFCSQYRAEGWYEQLSSNDGPLADAILDRIVHDSYKINIENLNPTKDISMREVYGLDNNL